MAALIHKRQTGEGFQCADQCATGCAVGIGHNVEAFVHAVNQIHIGIAGGTENHFCAPGQTAGGVRGEVAGTEVGFGFNNHASGFGVKDDGPEQDLGKLRRRNGESGQRNGLSGLPKGGIGGNGFVRDGHSKIS